MASAFLNLGLAGIFALFSVLWFRKGDASWGFLGAALAVVNLLLAAVKFRGGSGKREGP
jgi:hypothetical protein